MQLLAIRQLRRVAAALALTIAALPAVGTAQESDEAGNEPVMLGQDREAGDGPVGPAENDEAREEPVVMEEVVVNGVRDRMFQSGTLKDVIQKTELIDEHQIEARQAVNLSRAISQSPGVRVSNECSMCGVKRVMLNGMRGEHTTILTDGIPLHTMLSGYYAVDAIAMTGVSRIEVARGAGASLTAPEAIGGTLNVISKTPQTTGFDVDLAQDDDDGYLYSGFGAFVSDSGRTRASLAVQLDQHPQEDNDDNRVSEAPQQDNDNYVARISQDLGERDNVILRAAYTESEIFGGPTFVGGINGALRGFDGVESDQLFDGDDVRRDFTGKAWETTEWIDTERTELSLSWLHEFSPRFNSTFSAAYADHEQDSFYEGFDYQADNDLTYLNLRNNFDLNDNHLLTFGIEWRSEELRSDSVAGSESDNYIEDSFDYDVAGVFLQDTWTVGSDLEVALALRVDQVEADFVAPEKPGTEIDETVIAPRMDLRYFHNDQWTSRLSAGLGYRAPLSFFESDHGILDAGDGFAIDVDDLEESTSVTYAISFEGTKLASTLSLSYTEVEDLAAIDETEDGVPLLTQLDDDASVAAADIVIGYQATEWLTLGATYEHYEYDNTFQDSFAIAPIEDRAILSAELETERWHLYASAVWIGGRDLSDYGYEGFNVLGSDVPKSTDADAFATMDARVSFKVTDAISVYAGGNNLFDYTQVEEDESPLFWDPDGAYDVAWIYGPMRGRHLYAGFQFSM